MATRAGEAYLALTARNQQFNRKLQESQTRSQRFVSRVKAGFAKLKTMLLPATIAVGAFAAAMAKAAQMAAKEQVQTAQLYHQMGRMGKATAKNKRAVESLATSLQNFTRYGDTDTRQVLSQLMMLTNDFEGSLKNVELAFDLAESGMFDLKTAARYLGMAMTGDVTILGRYVAELKTTNTAALKTMTSSEKAAFAIDLLNKKFGGLAKQIGETTAGAWAKLKNAASDAMEAIGKGMLDELSGGLQTITGYIEDLKPAFESLGRIAGKAIRAITKMLPLIEKVEKITTGEKKLPTPVSLFIRDKKKAEKIAGILKDIPGPWSVWEWIRIGYQQYAKWRSQSEETAKILLGIEENSAKIIQKQVAGLKEFVKEAWIEKETIDYIKEKMEEIEVSLKKQKMKASEAVEEYSKLLLAPWERKREKAEEAERKKVSEEEKYFAAFRIVEKYEDEYLESKKATWKKELEELLKWSGKTMEEVKRNKKAKHRLDILFRIKYKDLKKKWADEDAAIADAKAKADEDRLKEAIQVGARKDREDAARRAEQDRKEKERNDRWLAAQKEQYDTLESLHIDYLHNIGASEDAELAEAEYRFAKMRNKWKGNQKIMTIIQKVEMAIREQILKKYTKKQEKAFRPRWVGAEELWRGAMVAGGTITAKQKVQTKADPELTALIRKLIEALRNNTGALNPPLEE